MGDTPPPAQLRASSNASIRGRRAIFVSKFLPKKEENKKEVTGVGVEEWGRQAKLIVMKE